ncbi:MAG: hypothetical protein IJI78_02010 [Oscillospiraceae bacterium]|nr:hypothetical protein [Oscillospiraceae bacterium]
MGKVNVSGTMSNTALRSNEYFRRSWNLKEISFDDLDSVYFRKRRLKACIQQMMDAINGRTVEIRALTTDFSGIPSEERVQALVGDLMDSLDLYIKYKLTANPKPPRDMDSFNIDVMSKGRALLFRSFLYLAVIRFMYTDADLADLIDYAANTPAYRSYKEFLLSYFVQQYLPDVLDDQVTIGDYSFINERYYKPDLFELNARSLRSARSTWLNELRSTQTAYYGLPDEPKYTNVIMQFRYLTHASEKEIDRMLDDLKERHIEVPETWISEYEEICETVRDKDLYSFDGPADWEITLFEDAITRYLDLQYFAYPSDVFVDAIAGMIDVYTVRGGGMAITDPDSFYKIFDNLKKIERFSLDHLSPFKKESL